MSAVKIVVFGAGGHAKVVVDVLHHMGTYEILGILDDSREFEGTLRFGYPVLGTREQLAAMRAKGVSGVIVALGDNRQRKVVYDDAVRAGLVPVSAIHPSAQVGGGVVVGPGSLLVAGTVVNVEASIGENVIINTGATVDHDCRIGAHVHLSPGVHLAGRVIVGEGTHIGIGAVVLPNISVGANCIIGAGAVVREHVPDGMVAVGNPARVIKENEVSLGF